ncbi:ribonuclease HII [Idiomarina sp. A28L]|uniref:ribonuclease HII n=1 Tax=Idiomarina sp. A28L TaxID=1036674 RepID=UPI0002138AEC|nr:ribonuclease HII [Idiomarina sp. A28L]EGN74304.1 ribonuclease HII [Idiomarina sp. A28L]
MSTPVFYICGADEAGRGPIAGPVVAAAVILDPENPILGITDSKKLSEKKRNALSLEIKEKALAWAIAQCDANEIDEINILQASMLAMKRAIESLPISAHKALIDGNRVPKLAIAAEAIIKGDLKEACIGAASILAKVERDRQMLEWHERYPEYNFAQHKAYGTAAHLEALQKHGASPIHRKSFRPVREVIEAAEASEAAEAAEAQA